MKKLFSVCALVVLCATLGAQTVQVGADAVPPSGAKNVPSRVVSKAGETVTFTYYPYYYFNTVGMGSAAEVGEVYMVGIYIPSLYAGYTVNAVSFYVYEDSVLTNVRVWASEELPDSPEEADEIVDVESIIDLNTVAALTTQTLSGDFVIPSGGCYVGYAFELTDASTTEARYPIIYDYTGAAEGAMFIWSSVNQPYWYDYGSSFGASSIVATLYGELKDNAVSFSDESFSVAVGPGVTATKDLEYTVTGSNSVYMFGYTITDVASGEVSDEEVVLMNNTSTGGTGTFTVSFPYEEAYANSTAEKLITITTVNDVDNEATTGKTITGYVRQLSGTATKKVVEEEFSTTDCGWCPRGFTALNTMCELYPDDFIGIGVHYYYVGNWVDPMYCDDYYDVTVTVSGFPSAYLNRNGEQIDPYYGSSTVYNSMDIIDDYETEKAKAAEASIEVTAEWNEDSTIISVGTETEFLYSGDADYGIAYVLIENGLTGTTKYWYQANYYYYYASYYEDDEYLSVWCNSPLYVTGLEYNHVALLAQDIVDGADGSIPETVTAEETISHSTTFDVSNGVTSYTTGEDLLQDKTQLEVVALLINRATGEITNADKCEVVDPDAETGIESVKTSGTDAVEVARYTLDGRAVTAPVKGVNIVKYSNGKTVKQVIK